MPQGRLEIVRDCYRAYELRDRDLIAQHLSDDLVFYSPADPGIELERYFERCWPNAGRTASFEYKRLIEAGEEVIVTYEATKRDGKRFCNTEILTFRAEKIVQIEVYFGWNLD